MATAEATAGRRRGFVLALMAVLSGVACSRGAAPFTPAPPPAGFPPPEVTAPRTVASRSVIEADSVAGIPLGATKNQAAAVLGQPTTSSSHRDSAGPYETLHWQLSGNRGLSLSFRAGSHYSPGLTDWRSDIRGPVTTAGVQVGDQADTVIAAYGPLADLCCASKAASIERGGGRMVVIVLNNTRIVERIVGGDQAAWMRTIAD